MNFKGIELLCCLHRGAEKLHGSTRTNDFWPGQIPSGLLCECIQGAMQVIRNAPAPEVVGFFRKQAWLKCSDTRSAWRFVSCVANVALVRLPARVDGVTQRRSGQHC